MIAYLKARWAELTTKAGLVLAAVAAIAPQFAQFDVKFAYAGAFAGVVMMIVKEAPKGAG